MNFSNPKLPLNALELRPQGSESSAIPPSAYTAAPTVDQEIGDADGGLMDYWRILVRHKKVILLSAFAGAAIGFAICIPMQPVFRAGVSMEVLNLNQDFMNMRQSTAVTTVDGSDDTSEQQTQVKLLQSRSLLDRVVSKLESRAKAGAEPKKHMAVSGWRHWLHLSEPVVLGHEQELLGQAAASLKIRSALHTRVIEATVESTEPKLAADFANTLVEEFIQQNLEARWNGMQKTGEWLGKEMTEARAKLQDSENALQSYARGSDLVFTDENTNLATEKLQQIQGQLSIATVDSIAKQSRFELAKTSPPSSLAEVLNDSALRDTSAKINDLYRQIADLTAVYSPEFSKVRRAQAELTSLQSAFERSRADILHRIENDYQESQRKEAILTETYRKQMSVVTDQNQKAIQYTILKRDVESNRQLFDTMLQQMKQATIASAMRASNVRVVDPAIVPSSPFAPNFKLNSALGMVCGMFLSIVLVSIRERADRTLQQPGDITLWTDLPELGTVPSESIDAKARLYGGQAEKSTSAVGRPRAVPIELITAQVRWSIFGEAIRSVLTSILFIGENGTRPSVLVFTSSNPADGKTTVVSNLAIAMAEIRRSVLVIDADLRRPRMHTIFETPNEKGLATFLRQEFSESDLASIIQKTQVERLDVIPAGPATHAAAHLLHSSNFAALLKILKTQYDMIIIDTPPMLPITDARIVGRLADAVVLIARAGVTTRDAMVAAKRRLEEDRTPVLGTILNDWDPRRAAGGYYGQYSGRYYGSYKSAAGSEPQTT